MCGPSGHLCVVDAPSVYGEFTLYNEDNHNETYKIAHGIGFFSVCVGVGVGVRVRVCARARVSQFSCLSAACSK
jgi:hypothetical protein